MSGQISIIKEKVLSFLNNDSPVKSAKDMTFALLKSGRINDQEAKVLLSGFEQINVNFTIDNHVEVNATHWGDIATGDGHIEDGYFSRRREEERQQRCRIGS